MIPINILQFIYETKSMSVATNKKTKNKLKKIVSNYGGNLS